MAGDSKPSNVGGIRGDDSADREGDAGGRGSRAPAHLSDINAIPVNWRARQGSASGPGFAAAGADVQAPPDHPTTSGAAPEASSFAKDAMRPPTPPRPPSQGGAASAPWMTPGGGASAWATPATPAMTTPPVPTRAPGTSVVGAAWAG